MTDYQSIHSLFEAQVKCVPSEIAVTFENQSLTYFQLNGRANALADALKKLGIGKDQLVAVSFERSIEMLIALLATLKVGAAYVPLDPTFPKDYIEFVLGDCQPSLILTQHHLRHLFQIKKFAVLFDNHWKNSNLASFAITPPIDGECIAYVTYTSGSTGRPKGVQIRHQSVVNILEFFKNKLNISSSDCLLAITTLSFDIAALELFLPLTAGARVTIAPQTSVMNTVQLIKLIDESKTTLLQATPATWRMLIEAEWGGKNDLKILCGGDLLSRGLANQLLDRGQSVWNLYGPTETTIWSSIAKIENQEGPVLIGRPIAGTEIYLLNDKFESVSIGEVGEIYIAGIGLAKGYLNHVELTDKVFIPNPFAKTSGSLMYRTGDIGRKTVDGQIEFLGRSDSQVKLNGYRIELGEIETRLMELPFVKVAVVTMRQESQSETSRLIAYISTTKKDSDTNIINKAGGYLAQKLPRYMLPTEFILLDNMPLTANGKIDRQHLSPLKSTAIQFIPESEQLPRISHNQTGKDNHLKMIWLEVLQLSDIKSEEDFFNLGGTSLLAVVLVERINKYLKKLNLGVKQSVKLTLMNFLQAPTLNAVTNHIFSNVTNQTERSSSLNLANEAILDANIHTDHAQKQQNNVSASSILLTGATGFLGAHLLYELLEKSQSDIYCLVRPKDAACSGSATNRVRANLEKYDLWKKHYESRIFPLLGDLALPRFGLSAQAYETMNAEIRTIYHNGAVVNLLYSYNQLKPVNVTGTLEVIRFACHNQIKPIHYISTISVFDSWKYAEQQAEQNSELVIRESDDPIFYNGFFNGYAESKWVAERLMSAAKSKGLPVSIYRPGIITGSSLTGHTNLDEAFTLFIKGCIQLGLAPDLDIVLDIVPVDFVAKAIVTLSLQENNLDTIFHLTHPQPISLSDMFRIITSSFGYQTRRKNYLDWLIALTTQVNLKKNVLASLLPLFTEQHGKLSLTIPQYLSRRYRPRFDCSYTQAQLKKSRIVCPALNRDLFKTYFHFMIKKGFLSEFNYES